MFSGKPNTTHGLGWPGPCIRSRHANAGVPPVSAYSGVATIVIVSLQFSAGSVGGMAVGSEMSNFRLPAPQAAVLRTGSEPATDAVKLLLASAFEPTTVPLVSWYSTCWRPRGHQAPPIGRTGCICARHPDADIAAVGVDETEGITAPTNAALFSELELLVKAMPLTLNICTGRGIAGPCPAMLNKAVKVRAGGALVGIVRGTIFRGLGRAIK